jgi:hypothetical protein
MRSTAKKDVKVERFEKMTESAVIGSWHTVGKRKLRHWGPKNTVWGERDHEEGFVLNEAQRDRRSVEAQAAKVCSAMINAGNFPQNELRRALDIMALIDKRFENREDTFDFAQSLANSFGQTVQVFYWNEEGERVEEGATEPDEKKKQKAPKRKLSQEEPEGDSKKRPCKEPGVVEDDPVKAFNTVLLKRLEIDNQEREVEVETKKLGLEIFKKIQQEEPGARIGDQALQANQSVKLIKGEVQAGTIGFATALF